MRYLIYALTDPRTAEIRYIGATRQPLINRVLSHLEVAQYRLDQSHRSRWHSANRGRKTGPMPQEIRDKISATKRKKREVLV